PPAAPDGARPRGSDAGREAHAVAHVAAPGVLLATRRQPLRVAAVLQGVLEHRAEVFAREVGVAPGDRSGYRVDRVRLVAGPREIAAADPRPIEPPPSPHPTPPPPPPQRA